MTMKMAKNDYENGQKWLWKWLKMTMKTEESQKWSLGLRGVVLTSYDEIESCREWKVESSHMCKNSSRRTPRPKNLIFILCFNKKGRKTKKGDENSKNTYKSLSLFSTFRRTLSTKLLRPRSKDPLRFLYYGVKI